MRGGRLRAATLGALIIAWGSSTVRAGITVPANTQSATRVIFLSITTPKKGVPPVQLAAHEAETVTLEIDGVGKFGFEPTLRENDASTVVVTVFDVGASPSRRLGATAVPVAGKEVASKTSPSFGIRIVRVTQPK
jgi:hypothetical protein